MEGSFFNKLRNKFHINNKNNYPQSTLYAFNDFELETLSKQNNEEIARLRNNDIVNKDEDVVSGEDVNDIVVSDISIDDDKDDYSDTSLSDSYVNLSLEMRENIMKSWNSIDVIRLSHDIDRGKDILDHNYIITYADTALEFIYRIRDEYDVLILYLIGFNNEKKGIKDKNIFSDKLDNEWKYLKNYIKVLETIRSAINK